MSDTTLAQWRCTSRRVGVLALLAAVVSRNSNEAIGECASRLLDDPRRLVSPYTSLQCPHRFSLFSCCSRCSPGGSTAISWTRSSISRKRTACLRSAWGGRRIRFTDTERCRLARKAHSLGRKVLNALHTLVTPDTLLRWYREMVACKWNYSHRRGPGRPRLMQRIVNLVLRMALENRSWGYRRIPGAMANLGHELGRSTSANILREYGVDPAPERDKHMPVSYTHLRAHETRHDLVCRLLLEKKKNKQKKHI